MSNEHYPDTFKIEAVKQVTDRGRSAADVAKALGVSDFIGASPLLATLRVRKGS